MRNILEKPYKLTQGTIFSNAKSCHFLHNVYGLIISGRCDIENSHYNAFLYLPIIEFKTWFYAIHVLKTSKKKASDAEKSIRSKFAEKKLSMEVLKYADRKELLSKHFNRDEQNQINDFFGKIDFFKKISLDITLASSLINNLTAKEKETYTKETKKLQENNYSGFFYLENVDYYEHESNVCRHFVIILNEVQTLPSNVANRLCEGIDLSQNQNLRCYFGDDDYSLAVSTVSSPYLECIIQNYTSLFRVGIERGSIDNYDFLYED